MSEQFIQVDPVKLADSLNKSRVFFEQILCLTAHEYLMMIKVFEASYKRKDDCYVTIDDIDKILDLVMPTKEECLAMRNGEKPANVVDFRRPK